MSWLSKWIDKRTGANRAIDVEAQQTRYDDAMSGVNAGYNKMMGIAEQQMDINSDMNQARLAQMEASSADNAAEASRLAQRTAASAGGAPAAALAFQAQDMAQKGQANVMNQYQQGMFQQTENALGTMGGVLANQGQMQQARFNMGESARSFNAQLEQQAAQRKAGMLGGALKIGGGLLMGNPAMALSGASSFMQQGGYIQPQEYAVGGLVRRAASKIAKGAKKKLTSKQKSYLQRKKVEDQRKRMQEFQDNPPDDYVDIPLEERGITMDRGLMHGGYVHKKKYNHGGPVGGGFLYQAQLGKRPDPKPVGNGESDEDAKASMFGMMLAGLAGANAIRRGKMPQMGKNNPLPGDIVDAKLEPGEYVLNRNAVNAVGKENLDKLNNEIEPRFDDSKVKMRMGGYLYG